MTLPDSRTVVVLGGGTMGAGIAQSLIAADCDVTIAEATAEAAEAAYGRVVDGLSRAHRDDPDSTAAIARQLARLEVADCLPSMSPELVVEAVPEDVELKKRVLADLARQYPNAVLATNTSSLSIETLAESVEHPARFVGMHFFNPVPRSDLIELVVGPQTGDQTIELAKEWIDLLDKTAIVVTDSPGFATSRLGLALGLEAIRMLETGVASAEDIDLGMVLGYKHPIGPLRLTDLVGLDVRLGIAEHLAATLGSRFDPPQLLRSMVADGRLGKKSGRGFYDWA